MELEEMLIIGAQTLGYWFCLALSVLLFLAASREWLRERKRARAFARLDEHEKFMGVGAPIPEMK